MRSECRIGGRGEIVIPVEMRRELGLEQDSPLEIELEGDTLTLRLKHDAADFDLAMERFAGSLRTQFLADGYSSVDEYIAESRGR